MSHLHHPVRILPVQVAADGTVQVFGLRYWSADSAVYAQRMVEIRVAPEPHRTALLVSAKGERLCEVSLVEDPGFVDAGAVAPVRAMRRAASDDVATLKIEALVELIDQRIEADRQKPATLPHSGFTLCAHNIYRRLRAAFQQLLRGNDMAEQQVLDRRQVVLELGKIIFGHRQSPKSIEQAKANASIDVAHRLSKASK